MQPKSSSDNRPVNVPARDSGAASRAADRDAAARIMREQINHIYDQAGQSTGGATDAQSSQPAANPYSRTHNDAQAHEGVGHTDWQHYHSAWQQYYQQYYERYYLQQIQTHRSRLTSSSSVAPLEDVNPAVAKADETIEKEQAVRDIRSELFAKIKHHSAKARTNRHFLPMVSAAIVMMLFLGLQYNRLVIAGIKSYVSPGAISPQNIILDPTAQVAVGPEPRLIIPKINVDAPVVYGTNTVAEGPIQNALRDGVVHYELPGASSLPGQQGNSVILGHSSNDVFDDGKYKFIFVQLDHLQIGDQFYAHYGGQRYTYSITNKEVIDPTEVNKLILDTDKPMMTLVTCTPPGTALKRLVIYAEQTSPDPAQASASSRSASPIDTAKPLPGNSPTLFERLFDS